MRRRSVAAVFVLGVTILLGSIVVYTRRVVGELRAEAARSGLMYAEVYRAITDTSLDPMTVLLELAQEIRESRVPLILTDPSGQPAAVANLPIESPSDPRILDWIARLDREHEPIALPDGGTIHIGYTPLIRGLRIIPALQVALLVLLLLAGVYALRTRATADRERVWAGMARESAHQLGTPLSSLSGWIELLREEAVSDAARAALAHMEADLERLERVAHRFERIGRPLQRKAFDLSEVIDRVTDYFRARVPSLAHSVRVETERDSPLEMEGDPVLVEWAIEALVKNAVDALAGRGGTIRVEGKRLPEGGVRLRVRDDGPGIPRELRSRVFEAGFSTKQHGWGIGLALARRIVADWHRGSLRLLPSDRGKGATFEIIFPA
jgi:signal transduction histidine kinase